MPDRSNAPRLVTDRLVLRGPRREDFGAFAEVLAGARSSYMGGPYDRDRAWALFMQLVGQWSLDGFGGWILIEANTNRFVGDVGILQPPKFPEPEIGWTLTEAAEGHGFATEAASAVLSWYWANSQAESVVSYITPGNTRSERLALRLGAKQDHAAPLPAGETLDETAVWRHQRPT
ncbi:MAG: GNAT family N-acetyltransferase [Pseudomonadota bacterium]